MEPTQRRGSWARALHRVRAAMKRRRSSTRSPQVLSPLEQDPTADKPVSNPVEPAAIGPSTDAKAENPLTPVSPAQTMDDPIAVETGMQADTEEELDEPLLPMPSSRTGMTDSRAKSLFERHGMKYEVRARIPQQEPPNKIRRVQKPVRLRVHWTCHECRTQFGMERVCTACGHSRCRDCTRHPPKRVRDIIETARQQTEQQQTQPQPTAIVAPLALPVPVMESPVVEDPDLRQYRQEPVATVAPEVKAESGEVITTTPDVIADVIAESSTKASPRTPTMATGGLITQRLDIDENLPQDAPFDPTEVMKYSRPRNAVIFKAKAQIVRTSCHKCQTHILPAYRKDCPGCGHERCDQCERYPPRRDKHPKVDMEPAPMVQAVQRVYRKPRQRVRYTCENCNTLFIDSDRCTECGHERCEACHREPPKRAPRTFDPEILHAVESRLAAYATGGFGITASAG